MEENQSLIREVTADERALLQSGRDLVFIGITVKLPDYSEASDVAQALFALSELVEDVRLSVMGRLRFVPQESAGGDRGEVDVGQLLSGLTNFHLRSATYGTPLTTIFVAAGVAAVTFALEKMAGGYFEEIGKQLASPTSSDSKADSARRQRPNRQDKFVRSLRMLGVEIFTYRIERRQGKRP